MSGGTELPVIKEEKPSALGVIGEPMTERRKSPDNNPFSEEQDPKKKSSER